MVPKRYCFIFFVFAIAFCNRALATPSAAIIVNSVNISGNHKTKDHIILRELPFQVNDSIPAESISEVMSRTQQNIFNLNIFNFVYVTHFFLGADRIDVKITVVERWYWLPFPILQNAETNFNTWLQSKDFNRINYGFYIENENFRGRKERLQVLFQWGFSRMLATKYFVPYINNNRKIGLWVGAGFSFNKEINYGSSENKRLFLKDFDQVLKSEYYITTGLSIRNKLYTRHEISFTYKDVNVADTVKSLPVDFTQNNATDMGFLSFNYLLKNDTRDNVSYPLKGHRAEVEATAHGFGLGTLGTNVVFLRGLYYHHLAFNKKIYAAAGVAGRVSLAKDPPYLLQQALGYTYYVRGYEYYVFDGQHYGLFKSNVKYLLFQTKEAKFEKIKSYKFNTYHYSVFLTLFADAGYVWDHLYAAQNPLSNTFLAGGGVGIDFVTYYDSVMRLEYSINKLGKPGLYIHLAKPL